MPEPTAGYGAVATNSTPVVETVGTLEQAVPRRPAVAVGLVVIGFIVVSVVLLLVAGYLILVLGPTALFWAIVLASVPLAVVLLGIHWVDRWEPEPRPVLLFAFLWGAAVAIFVALVFSGITQAYEAANGIKESAGTLLFETVVQAPIVEEAAKGFGILLLLWVIRRNFDGPVDGLVYGATIAVGFAFTENLQYFGLALGGQEGAGSIAGVFVLRAILSPFAHVMFTACTGLLLGVASRRTGRIGAIGYFLVGLVPAIALHALWNSSTFWSNNWFLFYFVVEVPLFVIAIVFVVRLRRGEQVLTSTRLDEYAAAGWFTQGEVNQLSSTRGRKQAIDWARRYNLKRQYVKFVQDATHLAFTRQKLIGGRDLAASQRFEAELLESIVADRKALGALPPLVVPSVPPA